MFTRLSCSKNVAEMSNFKANRNKASIDKNFNVKLVVIDVPVQIIRQLGVKEARNSFDGLRGYFQIKISQGRHI